MLQTLGICGLLLSPLGMYGGQRDNTSPVHDQTSPPVLSPRWLSLPLVKLRVYGRGHRHSLTRTVEHRYGWGLMVSLTWLGEPLPRERKDSLSW